MRTEYGLDPSIWGTHAWYYFHTVIYTHPPTLENEQLMRKWINMFINMLPCPSCRIHFGQIVQNDPLPDAKISEHSEWVAWGIRVHNRVNLRLHRPVYTYAAVQAHYRRLFHRQLSRKRLPDIVTKRPKKEPITDPRIYDDQLNISDNNKVCPPHIYWERLLIFWDKHQVIITIVLIVLFFGLGVQFHKHQIWRQLSTRL